jgi:hypothetical protein
MELKGGETIAREIVWGDMNEKTADSQIMVILICESVVILNR